MRHLGLSFFLVASIAHAQAPADFKPATTNVWGAGYPRVDGAGRVEVRLKAPEATKVRLNFWSGPKVEMVKQADGFWTFTTEPLVAGLHYYMLVIDGAEVADRLGYTSAGAAADFNVVNMVAEAASGSKTPAEAAERAQKRAERYYKV